MTTYQLRHEETDRRLEGVVEPTGDLDIATSPALRSALDAARRLSSRVRVDLTGVTFLDASTLGVLDAIDRACRRDGGSLTVLGASPMQRKLIRLGLLERLLRSKACHSPSEHDHSI